ncbi:hypothetical protein ACN28S_27005 [Cystobacter fuscus]
MVITVEVTAILEEEAELARQLGVSRGPVFLAVLVLASFVAWLLTIGLVRLGSRCITPRTRPSVVFIFAALCSALFPYTLNTLLGMVGWWMGPRPGALQLVWVGLLEIATFTANYRAFILLTVLAVERSRRPWAPRRTTLQARVCVLLGALASILVFFTVHRASTFPGLGRSTSSSRKCSSRGASGSTRRTSNTSRWRSRPMRHSPCPSTRGRLPLPDGPRWQGGREWLLAALGLVAPHGGRRLPARAGCAQGAATRAHPHGLPLPAAPGALPPDGGRPAPPGPVDIDDAATGADAGRRRGGPSWRITLGEG